jgi:opacity protein-like surface antigen
METRYRPPIHTRWYALSTVRAALFGVLLVTGSWAQEAEPDTGEVSAYTGVAFGAPGTHFTAGGSVGIYLWRYAAEFLEAGYVQMGNSTLVSHPGTTTRNSGLYDFALAFHVRVPIKSKWEPYFLLAPAALYNRFQIQAVRPNGDVFNIRGQDDWRFGFGIGPGFRYYCSKNWGLRGEYRYTISTLNFSRLQFGVFRQF